MLQKALIKSVCSPQKKKKQNARIQEMFKQKRKKKKGKKTIQHFNKDNSNGARTHN